MTTAADDLATELYRTHAPSLRRYARRLVGDPHRGEDLVQEALLRAWQHADRLYADEPARRGWLYRVLHNIALDDMRARGARPTEVYVADSPSLSISDETDQVLTSMVVTAAINRLDRDHRRVVAEVFLHGRTVNETARLLGIPYGTAKSRLFYGLRRMRRDLDRGGSLQRCA